MTQPALLYLFTGRHGPDSVNDFTIIRRAAPVQADDTAIVPDLKSFLDETISAQLRKLGIPGAAVAVLVGGQLLFAQGYSQANQAQNRPIDVEQTLFRTSSVGKLMVKSIDSWDQTALTSHIHLLEKLNRREVAQRGVDALVRRHPSHPVFAVVELSQPIPFHLVMPCQALTRIVQRAVTVGMRSYVATSMLVGTWTITATATGSSC